MIARPAVIGRSITREQRALRAALSIAVCLAIWSAVSYGGLAPAFFLPTPTSVGAALLTLLRDQNLLGHIGITLVRVLVGCAVTLLIAVPLGILAGSIPAFSALVEPVVVMFYYIPPPAVIPLSILWLGIGEIEKFFILFYGVGIYMFIAVTDIVAHTRRDHIDSAKTLGATTPALFTHVILPSALPGIWELMRTTMGIAWLFILIAEFVSAQEGVGHMLIQSQRFVQTANVLAVIGVIGLIGLMTDMVFKRSYKHLFPWSPKAS